MSSPKPDLLALLREARDWLIPGKGETALQAFVNAIDAALAEHEAEPKRKCGTCEHFGIESMFAPTRYWCKMNHGAQAPEFFCADWQRKGGA